MFKASKVQASVNPFYLLLNPVMDYDSLQYTGYNNSPKNCNRSFEHIISVVFHCSWPVPSEHPMFAKKVSHFSDHIHGTPPFLGGLSLTSSCAVKASLADAVGILQRASGDQDLAALTMGKSTELRFHHQKCPFTQPKWQFYHQAQGNKFYGPHFTLHVQVCICHNLAAVVNELINGKRASMEKYPNFQEQHSKSP